VSEVHTFKDGRKKSLPWMQDESDTGELEVYGTV